MLRFLSALTFSQRFPLFLSSIILMYTEDVTIWSTSKRVHQQIINESKQWSVK